MFKTILNVAKKLAPIVLTVAVEAVVSHAKDKQMDATITKKVAEAMANQAEKGL